MKQIALTAGADGDEAAFDPLQIAAAGLDYVSLSQLLSRCFTPIASMLKDGHGVGIMVTAGEASIFGLKDAANPTDSE